MNDVLIDEASSDFYVVFSASVNVGDKIVLNCSAPPVGFNGIDSISIDFSNLNPSPVETQNNIYEKTWDSIQSGTTFFVSKMYV